MMGAHICLGAGADRLLLKFARSALRIDCSTGITGHCSNPAFKDHERDSLLLEPPGTRRS